MAPYSYSNYAGIGQYGYNPAQLSMAGVGPGVGLDAWKQFTPQPGPAAAGTSGYAPSLAGYSAPIGPTMPAGTTGAAVTGSTGSFKDPLSNALYSATAGTSAQGSVVEPQKGMFEGLFRNEDGTLNMDFIGQLINGIGKFGSLALGFSANRQAKDALEFQKKAYETNLLNSTKSYNMALEDRAYARAAQHGDTTSSADDYINKHRL